ncbi:cupredoxin domain-containing protein [Candidatus Microgenomates bacterium]|nr:cupredoxin domain-containing protein [Candidatus Microgenomates bacterium]
MNNKILIGAGALIAVIAAVVLITGKGGYQTPITNPPPTPIKSAPPTTTSSLTNEATGSAQQVTVMLTQSGFEPATVTVKAGTKVIWVNNSGDMATVNSAVHPTHLVYPPLNFDQFPNGQSLSLVFDKPGTYKYHDHLNPSQTGQVIVE